MSKKVIIIMLVVLLAADICYLIWRGNNKTSIINNNVSYEKLIKSIDSLNIKIDSLTVQRNNLVLKLDSSKEHIKVINNWYEKEYNNITNQSTDSDCVFFSNYLSTNFK